MNLASNEAGILNTQSVRFEYQRSFSGALAALACREKQTWFFGGTKCFQETHHANGEIVCFCGNGFFSTLAGILSAQNLQRN